jgi:hypothetical protein
VHNDDVADQKNKYEGEAEESDMDESFIDDEEEPDESNDEARELTRSTCAALRNRRSWKETEFECPLCADIRAILKLLLKRK